MKESKHKQINSNDYGGIGSVLKSFRIIENLSIRELAEQVGVTPNYVSDVEANRKSPSLKTLEKYASVFGVRISTLLALNEESQEIHYNHKLMLLNILNSLQQKKLL